MLASTRRLLRAAWTFVKSYDLTSSFRKKRWEVPIFESVPVTQEPTRPEVLTMYLLNPDMYNKIEGEIAGISVTSNTTELQAGYMLGVQQVLKHLRKGYVNGPTR